MNVRISPEWAELIGHEFDKPYFAELAAFVKSEYATQRVFPAGGNIFRALDKCAPDDVKVVIIGQDPYHGEGQANGLCFSVNDGVAFPPSLRNIFKELENDLGIPTPTSGNLDRWAEQGVLLLNSTLTVRAHSAASHAGKGWEQFTTEVIRKLNSRNKPVIFLLWGNNAKEKAEYIDKSFHYVLTSVHPSPLSASRGFFGCNHFKKANEILESIGQSAIDWQIENI